MYYLFSENRLWNFVGTLVYQTRSRPKSVTASNSRISCSDNSRGYRKTGLWHFILSSQQICLNVESCIPESIDVFLKNVTTKRWKWEMQQLEQNSYAKGHAIISVTRPQPFLAPATALVPCQPADLKIQDETDRPDYWKKGILTMKTFENVNETGLKNIVFKAISSWKCWMKIC